MTDEDMIRNVIGLYCHHADDGELDMYLQLFLPDGKFTTQGKTLNGRDEIREFLAARPSTPESVVRHFTANIVVEVDGDSARARSSYLTLNSDFTIRGGGQYFDELQRDGETWRFRHRQAVKPGNQPV